MDKETIHDFAKAGLAYTKNGEHVKAIDCFRKAIETEPDQPVWVFVNLGNLLLKQSNYEEAISIFTGLKNQHPDQPGGYVGLARIANKQKTWQHAFTLWDSCFRLFPGQVQPFWYLHQAEALFELGNTEQAGTIYEFCTNSYPDNIYGFIGRAKAAQRSKQWEKALEYWQTCIDRFPSQVKPVWNKQIQIILLELGRIKDAQREAMAQFQTPQGKAYANIISKKQDRQTFQGLNFQHILIISYGRSGSTLLQGIINTIDGVVLRGENHNVFFDLFKTYQKIIDLKQRYKNALLPNQSWYGISFIDVSKLMTQYQELAKIILHSDHNENARNTTIGFKEIRYDEVGDELENYLNFLTQLFPNPAFIFNTRNLNDVTKSDWWKEQDKKTVIDELKSAETHFKDYANKHDNCFLIRYEDVIKNGELIRELFNFLGAPYKSEIIDIVLKIPHSYNPEQSHIKNMSPV